MEFQAVARAEDDDWPIGVLTKDVELNPSTLMLPPMVTVVADAWVTVVTLVKVAVVLAGKME